ncbi:hypothetical protein M408DRAFT_28789 [Serendipita vermifera MAFF 305830]|uniref:Uncharacterized protein n=1 Tax=Serendipita vermifera MAFF 305830 TaxID=933852 RepID=A0A0C2WYC4_SERVB|nr:hypothetical protein M408DRAFT_28789 [Serendipita vermifera MAFF 305830]
MSNFSPFLRHATEIITNGLPDWGSLPWINLQKLEVQLSASGYTLHDPSRSILISIFRSAPYLTHLILDFKMSRPPAHAAEPLPITHTKLEEISAPLNHFTQNGVLLGVQLDVPKLTSVVLCNLERSKKPELDVFNRIWTIPRKITLNSYGDGIMAAAELVRWYPSVHTLIIERGQTEAFFIFMCTLLEKYEIHPSAGPLPLPSLTTLRIRKTNLRGVTLLALINARIRHVRKNTRGMRALTSIEMYETPRVTSKDWKLVLEKLEEGRLLNSQIAQ